MKNFKTKLLSFIIAGALIFDATLAVSADTPAKASTKATAASSSIASDSKLDLRPIDVTTKNGTTKISRDNGATWATVSAATQATTSQRNGSTGITASAAAQATTSLRNGSTGVTASAATQARLGSADSSIGGFLLDTLEGGLKSSLMSPVSSFLNFGLKKVWSLLFPSTAPATAVQVEALQKSIDQVQSQLTEIQTEMTQMFNQLQNEGIKTELQTQVSYITSSEDVASLKVAASQFSNETHLIDQEPDDTSTSKQKSNDELKFMKAIYNSKINGEDLCSAVQAFGNQVTYVNPTSGEDLFGTFDELALYSYPWENQGYAPREKFRASVLDLYLQLSVLSQLSLKAANQYDWDWNTSGVSAQAQYQSLLSVSKAVNDMATNEPVVERPSNERYYQVPGHECLLANCSQNWQANATPNINFAINNYASTGWGAQDNANDEYNNGGQTSNSSLDLPNTRPTAAWLQEVYQDCGSSLPLYNIFFDKDEGGFNADSGVNSGYGFLISQPYDPSSGNPNTNNTATGYKWPNTFSVTTPVMDNPCNLVQATIAWGNTVLQGDQIMSWTPLGNYIGLSVLNQGGTPLDNQYVDSISSVSATNGSANVTMQYSTTTELNDFTATYSINGGASCPLDLTAISGSGANYTLSFDKIPADSSSQSVVITVSYGGKTASATAFTIDPYAVAVAAADGTDYGTLQDAVNVAAVNGGTVTLLGNITESDTVTTTSSQTITIDGGNYTLTAPDNNNGNSNALTVTGGGTLILKNITLQGGAANGGNGNSIGLEADSGFSGTVVALGTVNANGGSSINNENGVENDGSGTVNVSTANGGSDNSNGAYNGSSGVINVGAATGTSSGVCNNSSGVINVDTATASNYNNGIYNATAGTVNANSVISDSNPQVANGWLAGGTINVGGQATGNDAGTINTGSSVKTVMLHAGDGASCVLDSLTIAASGNTNVGTLPAVYDANGNAGTWFTDSYLTNKAPSSLSSSTTNLYSTFYVGSISSVSATNGSANVTMQPPVTTKLDDFTATYSVNGGASNPLALTGISGSGATYTLSFDKIPAASSSQSVVITISYGGKTTSAAAFTIDPAVAAVNGTNYGTLQDAVNAAATSGGTVALLRSATESDKIKTTPGQTITIDGGNYTLTAPDNNNGNSNALTVTGGGTLILKNITLQGGTAGGNSIGLEADSGFSGTVVALGTVTANGGSAIYSNQNGVENDGSGTVNVSTANGGSSGNSNGAYNASSGVINVGAATGTLSGVTNNTSGVINAGTVTATNGNAGIDNAANGTVNANSVISDSDAQVVNGWLVGGTINVGGQATGDGIGTINSGSSVKTVKLNEGDGASCVLDSLTIAASGNTNVGTLPAVYDANGKAGTWFTDARLTTKASSPLSSSTTNLYSTFYSSTAAPLTVIDAPASGASVNGTLNVSGWVLNTSGINRVDMYVYDSNGTPHSLGSVAGSALTDRSDVATIYANSGYANINNSGYSLAVDTTKLTGGTYTLAVAGIGKNGAVQWATTSIKVTTPQPLTDIDAPTNGASINGTLTVSGWALNTSGIDRVDMYAYDCNGTAHSLGSVAGSALTTRSDVATIYANSGYANIDNSGYSLSIDPTKLSSGAYTLAVAGIGKNGVVQWATASINLGTSQPLTDIDAPTNGASVNGTLNVSGWALNTSGIDRVDMYAYDSSGTPHSLGSVAGSVLTNRSDVAAIYANSGYANIDNSGYSLAVDTTKLAGGTYTLAVAGIGKNGVVQWATKTIHVTTPQALTDIDTPTSGTSINGALNVSGWVLNTSGIDRVDMYVFDSNGTPHSLGSVAGSALTNRSDVASVFANDGYANIDNSGYSLSVGTTNLAAGTYTLSVAGIGKNGVVQWATKTITIQ